MKTTDETGIPYALMVESSNDGIIVLQDGKLKFVNARAAEITGYSREEVTGKPFIDFVAPEYRGLVTERCRKRSAGEGAPSRYEMEILNREGKRTVVEVNASRIEYEGRPAVLSTIRDTGRQKEAERKLRESEERYRSLVEASPNLVYSLDTDGRFTAANRSLCQALGRPRREILGKNLKELGFPEDIVKSREKMQQRTRSGEVVVFEAETPMPDGTVHSYEATLYPLRGVNGEITGTGEISRDISRQKRAEEALQQESRLRDTLLDNLPFIALILKKETREIVASNEYARKIGAVPGKKCYETCAGRDEPCPFCLGPEVWKKGEPRWLGDIRYGDRYYEGRWLPYNEDLYIHYILDITERKRAEEEIRRFKTITDTAPYGVGIGTPDGVLTYVNESFAQMHGYRPEELTGKHFSMVYTEEQLPVIQKLRERLPATGSFSGEEVWHRKKGGTTFPTLMTGNLVRDEKGKISHFVGTQIDITERRQAEERIRESEDKYRAIFNEARDGIMLADSETGHIIDGNPEFELQTGRSLEQLKQMKAWELRPPEQREEGEKTFSQIKERGTSQLDETTFRKPAGETVPIEFLATVVTIQGRRYLQNTTWDITERKRAEEEIREAQAYLQTLNDSLPEVVLSVFVPEKKMERRSIEYANHMLEAIFGYTAAEAPGIRPEDLYATPEEQEKMNQRWKDAGQRGEKGFSEVFKLKRKNGDVFTAELTTSLVDMPRGDARIVSVIRDVTERERAEEGIRRQRDKAQRYLNIAGTMLLVLDAEGNIKLINRRGGEILGYKPEEITGKSWFDEFIPERLREEVKGVFRQLMAGEIKPAEHYVNPVTSHDGEERLISWYNTVLKDEAGNITGVLASGEDITELKRAEERNRYLNEVLRAIRNVNQLIVREKDREQLIQKSCELLIERGSYREAWIMLTDEARKVESTAQAGFGREAERFLEQLRTGNYPQCVRELLEQREQVLVYENPGQHHKDCFLAENHSQSGVLRCRLEYGGKLYGVLGATLKSGEVSDEEEIDLFRELCDDIGFALANLEREEMQRQAGEEIRKFKVIADNANYGVTITDMEGKLLYVNEFHARMHGYTADEVIGKHYDVFFNEEQRGPLEAIREKLFREGSVTDETWRKKRDGTVFSTLTNHNLIRDERGKPLYVASTHIDLTERKKMEEQLMVTDRMASIGELASGIAHEINNPLTGIIGISELVLDSEVPADVRDDLETIHSEAERTARIVQGLLTFARRQPEGKEEVEISEAIAKVLELRAYEQKVNNISVETRFDPDLPKVKASNFQMQQVFINLVINAEHFMKEAHGRGKLTVSAEKADGQVRISFTDDGPGIPPKVLEHIFDPFFTTKEVGKGTGLGLSICHGIISEHGGRIYAESEEGNGATFIIELPAAADGTGEDEEK